MEHTPEKVTTDKPKGKKAGRDPFNGKEIPISLMEQDVPVNLDGRLTILRKSGGRRPVNSKVKVTVHIVSETTSGLTKTVTYTAPVGYKLNEQSHHLEYYSALTPKILMPEHRKDTITPNHDSAELILGVDENVGDGTYYVSIGVEIKADGNFSGVDEILIRYDKPDA